MRELIWLAALATIGCGGASTTPDDPADGPESKASAAPSGPEMRSVTSHGDGDSCQAAVTRYEEEHGPAAATASTEAHDAIKELLNEGSYLNSCAVATSASVDICAAIVGGKVTGVTVELDPGLEKEADCVATSIRSMTFPESAALVEARTSFEPSLN